VTAAKEAWADRHNPVPARIEPRAIQRAISPAGALVGWDLFDGDTWVKRYRTREQARQGWAELRGLPVSPPRRPGRDYSNGQVRDLDGPPAPAPAPPLIEVLAGIETQLRRLADAWEVR
jgi:hypothetical protein